MTFNATSKIIGITGGIASGKTAASDILAAMGAHIIDADIVARSVLSSALCNKLIRAAFPMAYDNNGELCRRTLRDIAFADKKSADRLDKITHPLIIESIKKDLAAAKNNNLLIIIVAPLLFECNLHILCDETWQISANEALRIQRTLLRDNVSLKSVKAIIARQLPDSQRERLADKVISGNGTIDSLKEQLVKALS